MGKKKSPKKKDLTDPKELYHSLITEIHKKKRTQNLTDPQRPRLMLHYLLILKLWRKKPFLLKTKKLLNQKKLKTEDLSNANARYVKPGFEQKVQPKKTQKATI